RSPRVDSRSRREDRRARALSWRLLDVSRVGGFKLRPGQRAQRGKELLLAGVELARADPGGELGLVVNVQASERLAAELGVLGAESQLALHDPERSHHDPGLKCGPAAELWQDVVSEGSARSIEKLAGARAVVESRGRLLFGRGARREFRVARVQELEQIPLDLARAA